MSLTEKERLELESLENPNVEFISSSFNPILSFFFGTGREIDRRKARIVELRTKSRMEEAGLDQNKSYQDFYRIQAEEKERAEKIFSEEN